MVAVGFSPGSCQEKENLLIVNFFLRGSFSHDLANLKYKNSSCILLEMLLWSKSFCGDGDYEVILA